MSETESKPSLQMSWACPGIMEVTKTNTSRVRRMADKAMEKLIGAVENGKSRQMKAYLAMLGRFHRYSLGNVLLIASQKPDARRVAGYRTWQQLGRQVKQGQRGIRILAPLAASPKEKNEDKENAEEVIAFKTACVFDVSQTDGKELPEFAKVQGDPSRALERLKQRVVERGITLEYSNRIGPAEGASRGGRIILRTDLGPASEFSVLVHELAHEILHQDKDKKSKTVRETEAEAVAFAVCRAVGLDTNTASSDYIQLCDGKKKTLLASLQRIKETAGEIIEGVTAGQLRQVASPVATVSAA